MTRHLLLSALLFSFFSVMLSVPQSADAQQAAWQQSISYDMDVHMNVETNIMTGTQRVEYHNASPDTLDRFFYHLYYNAFQPGSMMDERSRTIIDPDGRVRDRIYHLQEDEIGYQHIKSLSQNGVSVEYEVSETVLIVHLNEPILPGESVTFDMEFEAQVPVQIRRTGRDNREGIRYSMSQWYPKVAEYDQDGWHTHEYIAREFHGVFGDFNVRITIDKEYTLGATGYLQNPQEVGHGYENPDEPLNLPDGDEITWHFFAPEVIDFFWGAHDEFVHVIHEEEGAPRLHLLYVERPETRFWDMLPEFTAEAFQFMNEYVGEYPYEQFTIIQGGDGGMEYPMGTLITGHRPLYSLVAVTVHELIHMWFQSTLATNESLHHWMDEGFTVYMSELTMRQLFNLRGEPHRASYMSYLRTVHDGLEENMGQHADRYNTNSAYSMASYRKGALILHQLEYIIGEDALKRTMRRYYDEWLMRHPTPTDFQRIAEKESGLQLKWYFDEMLHSTRTIDMGIRQVRRSSDENRITLQTRGDFHMPVDLLLTYEDGSQELVYIPTQRQLGSKPHELVGTERITLDPWPWTHSEYSFSLPARESRLVSAEIDPSLRMADINRLNNHWPATINVTTFDLPNPEWDSYEVGSRPALWFGENAGIRLGSVSRGAYLFGTKSFHLESWLTTGTVDEFGFSNFDLDYRIAWRDRLALLGPDSWWFAEAKRMYGINYQELGVERRLGRYGRLEPVRQVLELSAFHMNRGSVRQTADLDQFWEKGSLWGAKAAYELGNVRENGLRLQATAATFGNTRAAHQVELKANRTLFSSDYRYSARFGMQAAGGSSFTSNQQLYDLGSGTAIERWENRAYTAIANIDQQFARDARFAYDSGNALSGYSLHAPFQPGLIGNNMLAFSIWQSYRPVLMGFFRAFEFELFAGTGYAWNGSVITDFDIPSPDSPWLASAGAGLMFDFAEIPRFDRWTAQSALLSGLQVSIRSPFYLHGIQGHDDFEPTERWMIGVSKAF